MATTSPKRKPRTRTKSTQEVINELRDTLTELRRENSRIRRQVQRLNERAAKVLAEAKKG